MPNKSAIHFARIVTDSMKTGKIFDGFLGTNPNNIYDFSLSNCGPNHFEVLDYIRGIEIGLYVRIKEDKVIVEMWHNGNTNTETRIIARYTEFAKLNNLPFSFTKKEKKGEDYFRYEAPLPHNAITLGS